MTLRDPDPWYVVTLTLEEFVLGMVALGTPLDTSLVGAFDDKGLGSRRDVDMPLHRDGEPSPDLEKVQGGGYVSVPGGIDVVGLYCVRGSPGRCITLIDDAEVELQPGQALVFDNRKVLHGRRGPVGGRILMRVWIKRPRKE